MKKYIDDDFVRYLAKLKKASGNKLFSFRLHIVNVALAIFHQMRSLGIDCISTEMQGKVRFLQAFPYSEDSGKVLTLSTIHLTKDNVGRNINLLGVLASPKSFVIWEDIRVHPALDKYRDSFYNNLERILEVLLETTLHHEGKHSMSAKFIREGLTVLNPKKTPGYANFVRKSAFID